ncbi:MAG: alpha/beta hydrolase [Alphaproteobacteria bacterium]|nr:alpha/beta hydrolase [Alphaproteobacteria bacterium]MBV9374387.1 alpha/beta hydrolase [Alphaproteobacteria bacterium]
MLYAVLGSALAGYGVLVGGLYIFQRQLLYFPDSKRPELGNLRELGVREVTLTTGDGLALLAWYLPPSGTRTRPVIAYFHGNGGHIGYRAERLRWFAGTGYGMLMVEYRGFGGNMGIPTETGLLADGAAALDFLAADGIASGRLVIYGESLGSGVAVQLAANREVGGLILEAPFTSVAEVAQYHYSFIPASVLVRDRFDSRAKIGQVKAPILVLHGERDRVVPLRFGRALFDAAPEPKEFWTAREAGHENLARYGAFEAVADFLKRRVRCVERFCGRFGG